VEFKDSPYCTPEPHGVRLGRLQTGSGFLVIALLSAATPAISDQNPTASSTPLLAFAETQQYEPIPDEAATRSDLRQAEFALQRQPVPTNDCAKTLGAARFGNLWSELGDAHANRGERRPASIAFRRALECAPRDASAYMDLAAELQALGERGEARAVLQRGLRLAPDEPGLLRQLGRLEFVERNWQAAITQFERASKFIDTEREALYNEILYHLAYRRSGLAQPPALQRKRPDADENEAAEDGDPETDDDTDWPRAILEALRGKRDEQALLDRARDEDDYYISIQERLCEALFYIGQERMARGDIDAARRYFAATANTRVLYYIEHDMALAELANLRTNSAERASEQRNSTTGPATGRSRWSRSR
jgi:lipoprotein NlpI